MEAIISAAETGFTGSLVGSSIPWNQNNRARRYKATGAGHMTTTTTPQVYILLKGQFTPLSSPFYSLKFTVSQITHKGAGPQCS